MDVGVSTILADRYELGARLGRGAMAEVWSARDRRLERRVAIKLFDPSAWSDINGRGRFESEARLAASVEHPYVVMIYDVGIDDDTPYIVMECLSGRNFADEMHDTRLPIDRVQQCVSELLAALGAADACGVLHRDLKPANVLLTSTGHYKLTDFGIATSDAIATLTATGMVVGTPAYLAPERIAGEPASVRSDLFAVGVMGYEALAGERPWHGDSPIALAYAMQNTDATPLSEVRADVPRRLSDAIARAIARDPDDRYASAAEFAGAIDTTGVENEVEEIDLEATKPIAAVPPITATRVLAIPSPDDAPADARRAKFVVALALILIVFLGAIALAVPWHDSNRRTAPTNSSETTPTTATAPTLPPPLQDPFHALEQSVQP